MVNQAKGFTLIEFIIASAILVIIIFFSTTYISRIFSDLQNSRRHLDVKSDFMLIQKRIAQTLSYSDMKSFALTGETDFQKSHGRFLIPKVSVCADLSTGSLCKKSTTLIYSSAQRVVTSIRGYCWIKFNSTENNTFLVDSNIADFIGMSTEKTVLGIEAPGVLSQWFLDPNLGSLIFDSATNSLKYDSADIPGECLPYIPKKSDGTYDIDQVKVAHLQPVPIQNFTASISAGLYTKMVKTFPTRIQVLDFFSLGLEPNDKNSTDFSMRRCYFPTSGGALNCVSGKPMLTVKNIKENYLFEQFSNPFPSYESTLKYQFTGGDLSLSSYCVDPNCKAMQIDDNNSIPYALTDEDFTKINPTKFSWIKQSAATLINILLLDENNKEFILKFPLE